MSPKKQAALRNRQSRSLKQRMKDRMAKVRAAREQQPPPSSLQPPALQPPATSPTASQLPPTPSALPSSTHPPQPQESASKKKLDFVNSAIQYESPDEFMTTIIDLGNLKALFEGVVCRHCYMPVEFRQGTVKRLEVKLETVCQDCGVVAVASTSRKISSAPQVAEVNRSVVAASLSIGLGHSRLQRMMEVIGMPCLSLKVHQQHVKAVHAGAKLASDEVCQQARDVVREVYEPGEDGVVDLAVTYDGTWHKRGHTSNHGAAAVICAVTGLVLDTHVMSLHCQLCKTKEKLRSADPASYDTWYATHQPHCQRNYEGSSGGMEVAAAKVLWSRSLQHRMRYTTMIGDGDSKMYNAIISLNPYGDEKTVKKAECVNHVAKRLGTALRTMVNDEKKRGNTLGGRGQGTLTQEKIGRLQAYYTKAMRSSTDTTTEQMAKAVWATYYHSISTNSTSRHQNCPEGPDSWCFYNRALAHGDLPPPHKEKMNTSLNEKVAPFIMKVYTRLTDPQLLEKCLEGYTQNNNESFHAQIWVRCPKHIFVSRPRVEVATALALSEWNQGCSGLHLFIQHTGLQLKDNMKSAGERRDRKRLRKAEIAMDLKIKKRREVQKAAKQREEDKKAAAEAENGGPLYCPGMGGY